MGRCYLLLLFGLTTALFWIQPALAQPGPRPGIMTHGKFIGYVPPHLRDSVRGARLEPVPATHAVPQYVNPVRPVEYTETLPVDEIDASVYSDSEVSELSSENCESCCNCSPPASSCLMPSLWGRAEEVYWWSKPINVPALATTSVAGTPQAQAGVLGLPTTSILFGGDGSNDQGQVGGRATLGMWLDPGRCRGFDATYLMVAGNADLFAGSNNTFPILARPFFNVVTGQQDARRIAFPGEVQGTLAIESSSELQSFEFLYRWTAILTPNRRTHFMVGYRFAQLEDRIRIDENTVALAGPLAGATFNLFDEFNTRNMFNGVEAGIDAEWLCAMGWSLEAMGKVAVGETITRANIAGQVTTTIGGVPAVAQGGLLALPTNIGTFQQNEIDALGEFGLTLRRRVNRCLTASFGYTCLLWSSVARAGEQIDTGINTTQVPPGVLAGAARPSFAFDMSSYWTQGIRFGVEYAY